MFSFLKRNPLKKLEKQHTALLEQAMLAQRNGDIRTYSKLSTEADAIYKQIQETQKAEAAS